MPNLLPQADPAGIRISVGSKPQGKLPADIPYMMQECV